MTDVNPIVNHPGQHSNVTALSTLTAAKNPSPVDWTMGLNIINGNNLNINTIYIRCVPSAVVMYKYMETCKNGKSELFTLGQN